MEEENKERDGPIFRDIRRYCCDFCGICRSKRSLIMSHMLSEHRDEMEEAMAENEETDAKKSNTCEECGATFKKPAHLKQHMQSHSLEHWIPWKNSKMQEAGQLHLDRTSIRLGDLLRRSIKPASITHTGFERPFVCTVEDCNASYRRKDHLTRHLIQHQGKLFSCPVDGCSKTFSYQGNVNKHLKESHDGDCPSTSSESGSPKKHVCPEVGCGKAFNYASKLRKHADSHVKLDNAEAFCSECMKYFSNADCLRAHIQSSHQFTNCDICGIKYLKKNIKRHLRMHEVKDSLDSESIKCNYEGCAHTFSSKSNLHQHVKAAHMECKPFTCSYPGCGKRFSYKHVRDNHEKSGCHVYTEGDFVEADEQFRSRPRGGRKRKFPSIESLLRKRISTPTDLEAFAAEISGFSVI